MFHFDCVVFHDVDMLTEDDRNFYTCADQPRHAGAYIDKYGYRSVLITVLDITWLDIRTIFVTLVLMRSARPQREIK